MKNFQHIPNSFILLLMLAVTLSIAACSDSSTGSDDDDNGNGNGNGNDNEEIGTAPTYDNIQLIFNESCGGSGCHINGAQSGVQLNNYDNIIDSEGAQYERKVVQPEDADDSPLVDKIESNDPQFGDRMPLGGPYLSEDRINQIRDWIDDGAEEDDDSDDNNDGDGDGDGGGDGGGNGGY